MKKKRLNIVLLIIVVGIWSVLVYRIVERYTYTNPNFSSKNSDESKIHNLPIYEVKKDSFEIKLLQRDPFLNTLIKEKNINQIVNKVREKVISPSSSNTNWPKSVKYYGYIKREKSNSPLALLKVNNVLFKVKKGELLNDGILVRKIYSDSIVLEINNIKKIFLR